MHGLPSSGEVLRFASAPGVRMTGLFRLSAPGRWREELTHDPLDHRVVWTVFVRLPPVLQQRDWQHREQIYIAGRWQLSPRDGAFYDRPRAG